MADGVQTRVRICVSEFKRRPRRGTRDRRELTADRTIITLRSAEASDVEETMAMRLPARVVLVIAFSSLAGVPLSAQLQTGRLLGTVLDEQHAAVPGATVTVTNLATNLARAVTSDGEG